MATPQTTSSVVRTLLTGNINLTADEVVQRAKARGVTATPDSIRNLVYNIRGEVKKAAGASKALPVPPKTPSASSKSLPVPPAKVAAPAATSKPLPVPSPKADLPAVLANVALVHRVVGVAGGVEAARQVAEAVRACGGVDEFLQHLDLIAGMQA